MTTTHIGAIPQHREPMRVAWVDTDAGGRIHFTAALRWAEAAEHALLRSLDVAPDEMVRFPRRHVEATYHRPLRFNDRFDLVLTAEHLGRTSITYTWQAVSDGQICAEGRIVAVHVDETGQTTPLPPPLRALTTRD